LRARKRNGLSDRGMTQGVIPSSFFLRSFGEMTKLLQTPYVFMC
jgi:hypothetical protein